MSAKDFRDVDNNDLGRWLTECWESAEAAVDQQAMLDYVLFARECEAELERRTPTSRWSAIRLLNWFERASLEEIWWAVDPHLYAHKAAETARLIGASIDVVYSFRKACIRRKHGPSFELFIRLLSIPC